MQLCFTGKSAATAIFGFAPALAVLIVLSAGNALAAQSSLRTSLEPVAPLLHAEMLPEGSHPGENLASGDAGTSGFSFAHPFSNATSVPEGTDPRRSVSVRGSFLLPQNDLRQTTGSFPQISIGVQPELLLRGIHQIRPDAEWMFFRQGHQTSMDAGRSQALDTRVRALLFGGEYLFRIGGPEKRLSVGGGFYLVRWSVSSVDTVTLPQGTAQASGNSSWWRFGDGLAASYRLSHRLELQGRWIHSNYGYEHIPVNVATLGAGWRL